MAIENCSRCKHLQLQDGFNYSFSLSPWPSWLGPWIAPEGARERPKIAIFDDYHALGDVLVKVELVGNMIGKGQGIQAANLLS